MASFGEHFKESLTSSFEKNTGIIGQTMQARREKEAQQKQIAVEVAAIKSNTAKVQRASATLNKLETSFIQISKNFQLIAKAMDASITLQEETDAAMGKKNSRGVAPQPQVLPQQKAIVGKLDDSKEEANMLDKISGIVGLIGAAKGLLKGGTKVAGKVGAKVAGKGAAKVIGKEAAKTAGKEVVKEAAKATGKEAAKATGKAAIKETAKKSLAKTLGKLVAKSIPFVGAAIGIGFAVGKLMQGDAVGAGIEAASGLAGPISSIPLSIAASVREVYFETYGVFPENDPKSSERLQEVREAVGEEAETLLGRKLERKEQAPEAAPEVKPAAAATTTVPAPSTTLPPVVAPVSKPTVSAPPAPVSSPSAPPVPPSAAKATAPTPAAGGGEAAMESELKKEGFDPTATAAIMAQTSHESGHFKLLQENLNYSASGLTGIFGKYFNSQTAAEYQRQPEKIANKVYADRMGNGPEESGDGYKYRGRGFIQLTGKVNYAAAGQALGLSLVNQPDLAAEPANAAKIAIWYFKRNLKRISNWADTLNITKIVNGGTIGLADREKEFNKYLAKYTGGGASGGSDGSAGKEIGAQSTTVAAAKKDAQSGGNVTIVAVDNTQTIKRTTKRSSGGEIIPQVG